jgi:hypothetical protein
MGKSDKKPAAPDYTALATQQAALAQQQNQQALRANRPNQVGPTGSLTWSQDPAGNWTQTTTMNPQEKQIMEAGQENQLGVQGKIGEQLAGFDTGQIDFSGAPAMPEVGGYDQRSIDTIRALQAPQLERQRAAKEAQMAAMGVGTGSGTAWNTEQQNIGDTENRADLNAILAGIQQGNVQFGQGMQARQQGVGETLQGEQANLGKLTGLMGMGRDAKMPTFSSFAHATPGPVADITGAAKATYGAERDAYNADEAERQQLLGGLMGLGGSLIGGPIGAPLLARAGTSLANYFMPQGA